jgi:hypothetical protein
LSSQASQKIIEPGVYGVYLGRPTPVRRGRGNGERLHTDGDSKDRISNLSLRSSGSKKTDHSGLMNSMNKLRGDNVAVHEKVRSSSRRSSGSNMKVEASRALMEAEMKDYLNLKRQIDDLLSSTKGGERVNSRKSSLDRRNQYLSTSTVPSTSERMKTNSNRNNNGGPKDYNSAKRVVSALRIEKELR